jgi:hypothetical protein
VTSDVTKWEAVWPGHFIRFYWSDQVIEDEAGGACSVRNAYKIIVGRPKGKEFI